MYMLLLLCTFVSIYVKFIFQLFKFLFTCFRRLNLRMLHPPQLTFSSTHIATARQVIVEDAQKTIARQVILYYDKKNWDARNLNCFFIYSRLKWRPSLLNHPKKGKLQRLKPKLQLKFYQHRNSFKIWHRVYNNERSAKVAKVVKRIQELERVNQLLRRKEQQKFKFRWMIQKIKQRSRGMQEGRWKKRLRG